MEVRAVTSEEFDTFVNATGVGFGWHPTGEEIEGIRHIAEYDRTLATFDGEEIVSTTGIFSFDMTVPGGSLPTAGVTWVSVKPTHRRRGVLRAMMQRQLNDVHERGEALAALWASESIIYGRFGYGMAAETVILKIDRLRTDLAYQPNTPGRCRLVTRDEALASWPKVWDRFRASQPGSYSRSEAWWQNHTMREKDTPRGGYSGRYFVQYEEDGEPLGYVRYRLRENDEDGNSNGTTAVQELIAATDHAYAALWQYIFGIDLMSTITAHLRPSDEPLLWMLADPRRLVRRPWDGLWMRTVDVIPALEGRRYPVEGQLVLEIRDSICSWNEGRYQLEGGPDGATCRRTDAKADVTLGAADLGAVYMGGTRIRSLARAGRVAGDDAALAKAEAMFGWDPQPWCPEVF